MAYFAVGAITLVLAVTTFLCWRHSYKGGSLRGEARRLHSNSPSIVEQQLFAQHASTTDILIGPSADCPAMRISTLDLVPDQSARNNALVSAAGVSRLNSLLGAGGPLATVVASRGNLMQVEVAGQLARAAGTDGFRGFVREGGRIVEHAILNPSSIASVATGTFVFQLVSIVVAQKHLGDIDRKLKDLQTAVGGLQDYLEDGRRAEITSSMSYLRQVAGSVLEGEHDQGVRVGIEQREQQLTQVQHHLISGISRAREALDQFRGSDWVGSLEISKKIETIHIQVEALHDEWLMAHAARIAALQLLCATEAPGGLVASRRSAIANDLDAFITESLSDHLKFFQSKLLLIESWFNSVGTLEQRRSEANSRIDCFLTRMRSGAVNLWAELDRQSRLAEAINAPLSLGMEIEEGRVVRAFVLPPQVGEPALHSKNLPFPS